MILKASQRAGAADLAAHLLNGVDNETVAVAELRGTTAADLFGAFAEYEATAAGTRCTEPLYSLSINPPHAIDRAAYFAAIERIEQTLNLQGQPRAVIFHVKHGREHCHVVWSRIQADGDQLKAVHMRYDHNRLMDLSCAFFRELGVPLPDGLAAWADKNPDRFARPGQDYSRAEKVQSDATGITVAERRAAITEAFRASDSAEAFQAALEAAGYTLALGDRRSFVVLDHTAEIFSLARQIDGASTRDVKAKLAGIAGVPDVQKAKAILKERAQARRDRARDRAKAAAAEERRQLQKRHRRQALLLFIARLKRQLRDIEERLALKAKHKAEREQLDLARNRPLRRLLRRLPGVAAIIRHYERQYDFTLLQRQSEEREALRRRQELLELKHYVADRHQIQLHNRETRAVAIRAMSKEMRIAVVYTRRGIPLPTAPAAAPPTDPPDASPRARPASADWRKHYRQNAVDITQRRAAPASNPDTRGRTSKRLMFADNAADIGTRKTDVAAARDTRAPNLGAVRTSAAELIRNAKLTTPADAAEPTETTTRPQDPTPPKRPGT